MTAFYLLLAASLATLLNARGRWLRAAGTLLAALALSMLVWSILLANWDGTFAAVPPGAAALDRWKPAILNGQAMLGAAAALGLLWAAWSQTRRRVTTALPPRNGRDGFGRVSRYAHWMTAVLVLVLLPMGSFTTLLAPTHPERAAFLATHQSLGLVVLCLTALRLLWLSRSPPPALPMKAAAWERAAARATHLSLYILLFGFPLSGLLLSFGRGEALDVFGWSVTVWSAPEPRLADVAVALHGVVLPAAFCLAFAGHLGAVLKHHFHDRSRDDLRRMLR